MIAEKIDINVCHFLIVLLTLPVQRYLVPTPSMKNGGGGVKPTPMISKMVDSTTFNFGRPLGLSMRGKKLVKLMI